MTKVLLDVAGRRRSPATLPGFGAGRSPRNKGLSYPADPPNVEEIVAVMRAADDGPHGRRLRALIVVLWRAGLRIREALALSESDLVTVVARFWSVAARAADAVRSAWTSGPGSSWSPGTRPPRTPRRPAVLRHQRPNPRAALVALSRPRRAATHGSRRRRPAALRPASAPPRPRGRDGPRRVPLVVIQRQLGHSNLGITSVYLQAIDNAEIIDTVHARRAPMISVNASLRL
jgi:integrase